MVVLLGLVVVLTPSLYAQSSNDPAATPLRRFSYGVRLRAFVSDAFADRTLQLSNTLANTSQTVSTTTNTARFRLGPAIDLNLTRKWSVRAEAYFQGVHYTTTTENYKGIDDTTTTVDERTLKATMTERTRTSYWDFPVLVRYRGLSEHRILSQTVVEGGFAVRVLTRVRTGTETLNVDNTTAYNELPTSANRLVKGAVAGIGFQFEDGYHIKTTPQIRYTRWFGTTFQSPSSASRTGQLEIGVSFSF